MPYSSFAVSDSDLIERKFTEEDHPLRTAFQRDRDRIIHCKAFRRLMYKTQVFVNHLGDNFRTRLTHSIEVAQVARTVARALGLNEDLTEAVALAHDMGHPPFGHAGEAALNKLMLETGFDHNKQSLRIVQLLEERYADFTGLNLTQAVTLGLQKHDALPDGMSHSLEAVVVDKSDEVAYSNHDLEDGLEKKYLNIEELEQVTIWQRNWLLTLKKAKGADEKILIRTTIRSMINTLVTDLVEQTQKNITKYKIENLQQVLEFQNSHKGKELVAMSEETSQEAVELKRFLFRSLYRHPEIIRMNLRAKSIIERIFHFLNENADSMPAQFLKRLEQEDKSIVIKDFIAGMTDRYALDWNRFILGL